MATPTQPWVAQLPLHSATLCLRSWACRCRTWNRKAGGAARARRSGSRGCRPWWKPCCRNPHWWQRLAATGWSPCCRWSARPAVRCRCTRQPRRFVSDVLTDGSPVLARGGRGGCGTRICRAFPPICSTMQRRRHSCIAVVYVLALRRPLRRGLSRQNTSTTADGRRLAACRPGKGCQAALESHVGRFLWWLLRYFPADRLPTFHRWLRLSRIPGDRPSLSRRLWLGPLSAHRPALQRRTHALERVRHHRLIVGVVCCLIGMVRSRCSSSEQFHLFLEICCALSTG